MNILRLFTIFLLSNMSLLHLNAMDNQSMIIDQQPETLKHLCLTKCAQKINKFPIHKFETLQQRVPELAADLEEYAKSKWYLQQSNVVISADSFKHKNVERDNGFLPLIGITQDKLVVAYQDQGDIELRNLNKFALLKILQGNRYGTTALCTTINDIIIVGSTHGTIRLWQASTEDFVTKLKGHEKNKEVSCLLSVADKKIISGSSDNTIKIWDIEQRVCNATLKGHVGKIVALHMIDNKLISAALDNSIKIWDIASGSLLSTTLIQKSASSFYSEADILMVGSANKIISYNIAEDYSLTQLQTFGVSQDVVSIFKVKNNIITIEKNRNNYHYLRIFDKDLNKIYDQCLNLSVACMYHSTLLIASNLGGGWMSFNRYTIQNDSLSLKYLALLASKIKTGEITKDNFNEQLEKIRKSAKFEQWFPNKIPWKSYLTRFYEIWQSHTG